MLTQSKYIISSSYGNDSVALMVWAHLAGLSNVEVVFIDTGWSAPGWIDRVKYYEYIAQVEFGFKVKRIEPVLQFEELIRSKKGFPGQKYQWCSLHLKVVPFLDYMDEIDPDCKDVIMIGKRRSESQSRASTPEFIPKSELHGDRPVWHPLCRHTDEERDELLSVINETPLPHRSMECSPCVNANRNDMRMVTEERIVEIETLESAVSNTMFRPYRHMGAKGVREVMKWARSDRGKYELPDDNEECASGYCGI